jgi:hypothetical protein
LPIVTEAAITYSDLYTLGALSGSNEPSVSYRQQTAAGGQVAGYDRRIPIGQPDQALLWTSQSPNGVPLHPAGAIGSLTYGTNGIAQVGVAYGSITGNEIHSALWRGSAGSYIDLHPAGFTSSSAYATNGTQQVGEGVRPHSGTGERALLWSGSAASVVDLHPAWLVRSSAYGTDGVQQVGTGESSDGQVTSALLWNGTAESCIDLGGDGPFAAAYGVRNGQQVGTAGGTNDHAALWRGAPFTYVSLHPAGYLESIALDTDGTHQVGYGQTTESQHYALLWNGTADSVFNLHSVLPSTFIWSRAYTISDNEVYGLAYDANDNPHAIVWTIPEPTSLTIIALGAGLLARRTRG